jgi:hypothetical protein
VVLTQGEGSSLKPIVRLICALPDGEPLDPETLDLHTSDVRIVEIEDPQTWGIQIPRVLRE